MSPSRGSCRGDPVSAKSEVTRSPVGIVGLGAVGTSIGLALRDAGEVTIGFDISRRHIDECRQMGAIRMAASSLEGLSSCKSIFVAVPPGEVVQVSRELLAMGRSGVVDVASVKTEIADAMREPRFVATHPLRGTHLSGPRGARKDLFVGAAWAVCPRSWTRLEQVEIAEDLIRKMGAAPLRLSPEHHDAVIAGTSHLPHVVASSLVHVLGTLDRRLAARMVGGGFLDTTRIARANPALWTDISLRNGEELDRLITELVRRLEAVRAAVGSGDAPTVLDFFSEASRTMEELFPERAQPASNRKRDLRGVWVPRTWRRRPLASELRGAH